MEAMIIPSIATSTRTPERASLPSALTLGARKGSAALYKAVVMAKPVNVNI